jgi:hypothetical protein
MDATEQKKYAVMVVGKQTPSKLYDDIEEAEKEAKRLCNYELKTVYVLQTVSKFALNTVIKTEIS